MRPRRPRRTETYRSSASHLALRAANYLTTVTGGGPPGLPTSGLLAKIMAPGMTAVIGVSVKRWVSPTVVSKYYIDKRTGSDANNGRTPGTAWKSLKAGCNQTGNGTHTIEIIAGSGPYDVTDLGILGYNQLYPTQSTGSVITWNFNGNWVQFDLNVNDGSKKWTQSSAVGKTDWYYLTEIDGASPKCKNFDGSVAIIPQVQTAIVDGSWAAKSCNLNNPPYITPGQSFTLYGRYLTNNWYWGNLDGLAFNTLYVRFKDGQNPTGDSSEIWVPGLINNNIPIYEGSTGAKHIFNDAIFSGANDTLIQSKFSWEFNRCQAKNINNSFATLLHTSKTTNKTTFCTFRGVGHSVFSFNQLHDVEMTNCHTEDTHIIAKLFSNTACLFKMRNNTSKNLLAGGIQCDVATPTVDEDYNQFHIDPDSTHGDKALAFTAGTRYWLTTGAHSLPASTPTSQNTSVSAPTGAALNVGINPFVNGDGDRYDKDGYMVWSDVFDAPVYHARSAWFIGPYAYGGANKVYNSPTIISGDSRANYVLEMPICPTLYDADDGSIYTGIVPNQINLATFVDTDQMRWGSKYGVFYGTAQDAATIIKIDRAIGNV